MENDLTVMRRCGGDVAGCGLNISQHLKDCSGKLEITGNTGFSTVATVTTVSDEWTSQVTGFSRRLGDIGRAVTLTADEIEGEDVQTGEHLDQLALPPQIV
jgi:hypothetical protein